MSFSKFLFIFFSFCVFKMFKNICLFEVYFTILQIFKTGTCVIINIFVQKTSKFNVNNFQFNFFSLNHNECILQIRSIP
jgi:hypothetical protein